MTRRCAAPRRRRPPRASRSPARARAHRGQVHHPGQGTHGRSTRIRTVTVTFTGPIQRGTLRVTGPGKVVVSVGSGGRDPRKVTRLRVGLKRSLKAGRYKARWNMVAADGHHQHGSFRFRIA